MSIFPEVDIEIDLLENTEILLKLGKVFLFDFSINKYVLRDGKLVEATELQAVMQWANLCLRTYINKYKVYVDTGFGANIEDIIGKKLDDFYTIELEREIKEALLKNPRIVDITDVEFIQMGKNLKVNFSMELYNGDVVSQEVII